MISAVALMASFASCNKIEQENTSTDNTPVETPVVGETTTLTVSAAIPDTKTYLNGGYVKWLGGDVITVFASDGTAKRSDAVTGSAAATYDFTVTGWDAAKIPLYALAAGPESYYSSYEGVSYNNGVIRVKLLSEQILYHKNSFSKTVNISVGELTEDSGVYRTVMRNLCGLIGFKVEGTNVKRVVISDADGKSLTGEIDMVMSQEGDVNVPTVKEVVEGEGVSSVTITATSSENLNGKTGMIPAGSTVYACVLPGEYNLKIEAYGEGDVLLNTLTAKEPINIVRNQYSIIDVPVDTYKPSDYKTITILATSSFSPALPTSATKTKESYVLTVDGTEYPVTFYNPSKGFWKSGNNIRLCGSVTKGDETGYPGYMTLPGIDGFSLTAVEITGGNTSGSKTYVIYDKDPIDSEVTDEKSLGSVTIAQTATETITLSESSAGVSYYLTVMGLASDSNAQFSKLVLTYTKVN